MGGGGWRAWVGGGRLWWVAAAGRGRMLGASGWWAERVGGQGRRVAAHAGGVGVGAASGATSTAAWWAHATRQTRLEAHRKMHLAMGLERFPLVRDALAAGDLVVEQAAVIVHALAEQNPDLDYSVPFQAEARLAV